MDILDNVNDDSIDNTISDNIDNLENLDSSWWRCPSFFSLAFEIVCLCIEVSKFYVHNPSSPCTFQYRWHVAVIWRDFVNWNAISFLIDLVCPALFSIFLLFCKCHLFSHLFSRFCFLLFRFCKYFPPPVLHYFKIFNWLLFCFLFCSISRHQFYIILKWLVDCLIRS